jgi:hypothetical protein
MSHKARLAFAPYYYVPTTHIVENLSILIFEITKYHLMRYELGGYQEEPNRKEFRSKSVQAESALLEWCNNQESIADCEISCPAISRHNVVMPGKLITGS